MLEIQLNIFTFIIFKTWNSMINKLLISASLLIILSSFTGVKDISGRWKGVLEMPDGDFELFFNFSVDEKEVTGYIDIGISLDMIENGIFKTDTNFTFEAYSDFAQDMISYSATIKEEKISVEIVGYSMWIELERVKDEK